MNDQEFFNLLNQYPLRSDNPTSTSTTTNQQQQQQQPNLFSLLNNVMGGMNRNQSGGINSNSSVNNNKEEDEFWSKLKQFLDKHVNNPEEANTIYNNFKKNHLNYIDQQKQ